MDLRTYGPAEQAVVRAFSDEGAAALANLPTDFRPVSLLADLEGHSYREIADLFEVPTGMVMSRLARSHMLLHAMCRDYARKHASIEG